MHHPDSLHNRFEHAGTPLTSTVACIRLPPLASRTRTHDTTPTVPSHTPTVTHSHNTQHPSHTHRTRTPPPCVQPSRPCWASMTCMRMLVSAQSPRCAPTWSASGSLRALTPPTSLWTRTAAGEGGGAQQHAWTTSEYLLWRYVWAAGRVGWMGGGLSGGAAGGACGGSKRQKGGVLQCVSVLHVHREAYWRAA